MVKIIEWPELDTLIKNRIADLGLMLSKYPGDMQDRLEELLWIRDAARAKLKDLDKEIK